MNDTPLSVPSRSRARLPLRFRRTLRSRVLLALVLCTGGVGVAQSDASAQDSGPFDLVVMGGRVLDGTGNPWFRADIGVRDGRIVAGSCVGRCSFT